RPTARENILERFWFPDAFERFAQNRLHQIQDFDCRIPISLYPIPQIFPEFGLAFCGKSRGQTELSTVRECVLLIAGWRLGTVSSVPLFATACWNVASRLTGDFTKYLPAQLGRSRWLGFAAFGTVQSRQQAACVPRGSQQVSRLNKSGEL